MLSGKGMLSGKRYVKWKKGKGMLSGKRYVKWQKVC